MVNVVRILTEASSRLRANLLHNASMASGELFHSNMLAFLLEQTRPEQTGERHAVLESFLHFAGCPEGWPITTDDLGKARATVTALQTADNRLRPEVIAELDDEFVASLTLANTESTHDFVQRERQDFDVLVTLNRSAITKATCRARNGHAVAWNDRTLADVAFGVKAPHFRLAVEVKVKSIATDSQIRDQWQRLQAMSEQDDRRHHLLLTLYPFDTSDVHPNLTVRTFHEYVQWLRRVHPVAGLCGVEWIPLYSAYLKLLRLVARCTFRLIQRAHLGEEPYRALDAHFHCLRRCRLYASYQKTRASFMAAQLEHMLRNAKQPIGKAVKAKDLWPSAAAFHVYSHYSNGAAGFGVVFQHATANVLESAGIQVQGQDYRPYVSWDWKVVNGRVEKVTTADVGDNGVHLVEQRREGLTVLAHIAGATLIQRNFDHRWRGYGRSFGDLSAQQLVQTAYADALQVRAALQ